MSRLFYWCFFYAALTPFALSSWATADLYDKDKYEFGVYSGFFTHHFDRCQRRTRVCRDNNSGVGVEVGKADWGVATGHFVNSVDQPSNYLQIIYRPEALRACAPRSCIGLAITAGYLDGYNSNFPVVALPFVYLRYSFVEAQVVGNPFNFALVPPYITTRAGVRFAF